MLRFCATLVAVFCSFSVLAQGYTATRYDIEHGLPQNYIYAVVQDTNGYLWAGTGEGLARFDGHRFEIFNTQTGLSENFVTAAYHASDGRLWFGHFEGGISVFSDTGFAAIELSDMPLSRVNAILEDRQGIMWMATQSTGLITYDPATQVVTPLPWGLENLLVYDLLECPDGSILLSTHEGLWRVSRTNDGSFQFAPVQSDLPRIKVTGLVTKPSGKGFFAATEFFGVYECDFDQTVSSFTVKGTIRIEDGLSSNNVKTLYMDDDGALWIATERGVIQQAIQSGKGWQVRRVNLPHLEDKPGQVFLQDREGGIWLGTYGRGLFLLNDKVFLTHGRDKGLIADNVTQLLIDTEDRHWFATDSGLSMTLTGKDTVYHYTTQNGLPENHVSALHQDREGNIWGGTADEGLFLIEGSGHEINITAPPVQLSTGKINGITSDKFNHIWISTTGGGVFIINQLVNEVDNLNTRNGLSHNDVFHTYIDSKNRAWLATQGGPLNMIENNQIQFFGADRGLSSFHFKTFAEDRNHHIWVGTYGQGVFRFDGEKFINYDLSTGLLSDYISLLICDANNNVWVGSKNGLTKIDQERDQIFNYTAAEHLNGGELNANATARGRNGDIWFGSTKGAVQFRFSGRLINPHPPKTNITRFLINGKPYPTMGAVELPFGTYTIDLDFVGISHSSPEKVVYQYQLQGYESEWSVMTHERSVRYSNVRDGDYTFLVRAANQDGVQNSQPVSLTFTIRVPFWKTWWFRITVVVVLALAIYVFSQLRVRNYKRRQAELESQVNERTSELQQEKEIVVKQNEIISSYYHDITDSIAYAKRIQDSVLPHRDLLDEILPGKHFQFWKPRDIVSGDFPWYIHKEEKIVITAADCTGHGVPGAFMSLIGHSGLLTAVEQEGITRPSKILARLSQIVVQSLVAETNQDRIQDGMDMALCTVDRSTQTLEFAGANNSLFILRKDLAQSKLAEEVPELICFEDHLGEIKGDKRPVGAYGGGGLPVFNNYKFTYQPGDRFYLFSDGYADQFGGPRGKKFMIRQFKRLLISIFELPFDQQHETLSKSLDDWKGELDQVDDILVIGFEP